MQRSAVFMAVVILLNAVASAAEPKVVPLEDIAQHVGEQVAVEMVVQSSRMLESGKFCFLNSKKSYTDKDNFTVSIRGAALREFAAKEIEDPAEYYLKKKIRVRGKVTLYKEKPQIVVDSPEQIVMIVVIE